MLASVSTIARNAIAARNRPAELDDPVQRYLSLVSDLTVEIHERTQGRGDLIRMAAVGVHALKAALNEYVPGCGESYELYLSRRIIMAIQESCAEYY